MALDDYYESKLKEMLNDKSICSENRKLYKNFFKFEEYKLKRTNSLTKLDDGTCKTLICYIYRIKNVNTWFRNKPLKNISKDDIKRVYDALEEGKIKNSRGKNFSDRKSYYNKIFRSKLFQMINKADIARQVIEFYKPKEDNEVRFIKEETFRQLVDVMINPRHKLLSWLAFDIGENINSLLKLKKSDCIRQISESTKEPEYRINLDSKILKRSRTARTEITNFRETVQFLDIILKDLQDKEQIFTFQYRMAKKFLDRAVIITGAKCIPKGQSVTWKDLRSSMACDLLLKAWTLEEINARLGHKPSSREIDKYITFLAIGRNKPKQKIHDSNLSIMKLELDESKEREKLHTRRIENLQKEYASLESRFNEVEKVMSNSDELLFNMLKNNPKLLKSIALAVKQKNFTSQLKQLAE